MNKEKTVSSNWSPLLISSSFNFCSSILSSVSLYMIWQPPPFHLSVVWEGIRWHEGWLGKLFDFLLVQFSSVAQLCLTLCDPMACNTAGFPVHHQLPEFTQTHVHRVVMPSNYLILCHPLLLLPSVFLSIRVFSNESALCIKWPEYWSFSFSISPSNEYSGLISFRMDWLDVLTVQGPLKSLLQHHSSKCQFFGTQLALWSNSHIHTWLLVFLILFQESSLKSFRVMNSQELIFQSSSKFWIMYFKVRIDILGLSGK